MARRARYGRRPSVQQSVGGTLVSIAREMQAKRDSNIMDAWKNGGEFEGKPVTDDMALAYWKKRESTLDKADPTYDSAQDQIMQLQYGIEQSKADLAHVQGKLSDSAYAQFFIKWSNKVPKNGEFWRVLQKDAAGLMEQAKATAKANADKAKVEAFNKFTDTKSKDINLGNSLTDAIQQVAKDNGLDVEANGDRVLELLSQDYQRNPDKYHLLADAIKASGGTFNGTFTHDYVAAKVSAAGDAYGAVATRAHKDGYADAYKSAAGGQGEMSNWGADLKVWSPAQTYDKAYAKFSSVWNDPNASYRDKADAAKEFSGVATKLAATPGISQASADMFKADAARALGQDAGDVPSFGPTMLGPGHDGIDVKVQQTVAGTINAQALMDQTPGAYVYASMTPDGAFDPSGKSPVGIVAAGSMPSDAKFIMQPGLNGKPAMVAVEPHDVVVQDPNDPSAKPTVVGKTISYQVGAQTVTLYGYQDSTGTAAWTLRNPYADGVTGQIDKGGNLVLTVPGQADPVAKATSMAQSAKTPEERAAWQDVADQLKKNPGATSVSGVSYQRDPANNDSVTAKITVKYDGSGFSASQTGYTHDPNTNNIVEGNTTVIPVSVNTPQDLANGILSPSVRAGGPQDSYSSPVAASVAATASTMSGGQVGQMTQDPSFQHAFLQQTMQTLGITNPLDPRIETAWNAATARASGETPVSTKDTRGAGARKDLNYPGAQTNDPSKTTGTIGFAGHELKLPGLPAYLAGANGQGPNVNLNPISGLLQGVSQFANSVLQPGNTPGLQAPGTPTATPTATGGTVTPTSTPTPTTTPAPAAAPPATVLGPGAGPTNGVPTGGVRKE